MTEQPILFCGEMVRAILDGRKTQTRRADKRYYCPFQIGQHLWVRETWALGYDEYNDLGWEGIGLWPDRLGHERPADNSRRRFWWVYKADENFQMCDGEAWRASIHMPRWASRIVLEITNIRVEPLQAISEEDAIAEGVDNRIPCEFHLGICPSMMGGGTMETTHREKFKLLWDSLNTKSWYSWDSNPWVWVIEFKRLANAGRPVREEGER